MGTSLSPLERSGADGRRRAGGLLLSALGETERAVVADALAWCGGVKRRAAQVLGVSRVHLDRLIARWALDPGELRRGAEQYTYQSAPEGAPWVKSGVEEETP